MCGIAGIWGEVTTQRLAAMGDALNHRGPDDRGQWMSDAGDLGFDHRRLCIIDPKHGRQPMSNEDGRIVTVFNGAIYNYRDLRADLESKGHRFRTQSDTESLVHLYEQYGADFVEKIHGIFALAVWDDREKQLILARDRLGKKPLFFSEAQGEFRFASEIKGLVADKRCTLDLDHQALSDYLSWGCVPAPQTIYRQVRSLEPGELTIVRERRVVTRRRYWRQRMVPKLDVNRREAVERVDEQLQNAVRLRLQADVPIGSFLSGGIDSGIVTAIAATQYDRKLTTITVGFDDDSFDERPLARTIAQRYDTDHHEVTIRPDLTNDLPSIARAYDQPYADSSAIPSFYAAQAARKFVKVVLNGDGGDEVFAGYRRCVAARLSRYLGSGDSVIVRAFWSAVSAILPTPRRFRSRYAFAHRLFEGLGKDRVTRYMAWSLNGMTESDKRGLCGRNGEVGPWTEGLTPSDQLARDSLATLDQCGPVDQMLGTDLATVLPSDLLVKMDIACMAHGLEGRSPFLDQTLVDVASRFPGEVKLSGVATKPILRELARRYLPDDVCAAPKRGFEIPLVRWLSDDLRGLVHDVVLSRNGLLASLFDRRALEALLRNSGRLDPGRWSRWVWTLLMLGMWDQHARAGVGDARSI